MLFLSACGGGGGTASVNTTTPPSSGTPTGYTLTVAKSGSGSVASSPAGINCGGDCSESYTSGTSVTLTATAATGYTFSGWSGSGISCGGTGSCTVSMTAARTVTATFSQNSASSYTLNVTLAGSGSVTSSPAGISCGADCSQTYDTGTQVTLTATPASGYTLAGWSGNGVSCPGTGTCAVTMSADRNVVATFTWTAGGDVTRVSVSGFGYVTSDVDGISCGSIPASVSASSTNCVKRFTSGNVTLTATPYSGNFRFDGWSGDCAGTASTCTLDVSTGRRANARFVPVQPTTDVCSALGLKSDKTVYTLDGSFPALAVGQAFTDPKFGTTIRRVTDVKGDGRGSNNVLKTVYSTISAWNADESYLILYRTDGGPATHELYNGKTYQFIRALNDINPVDLEQVYWDTYDPDILYYADRTNDNLYRYHVSTGQTELVRNFTPQCTSLELHGGGDPMFNSWNSTTFGFACTPNGSVFSYNLATNSVGRTVAGSYDYGAPQASPSGVRFFMNENDGRTSGRPATVRDADMNVLLTLDLASADEHGAMSMLSNGDDTWNAVAFDPGPSGSGVGALVQHNMVTGASRVIVGPSTGYSLNPSGTHVGATAFHRTGLVTVSIKEDMLGDSLLDDELLYVDTDPATNPAGSVCRVGHHRTVSDDYWAEPHPSISPSGTRILFSSSWGDPHPTSPSDPVHPVVNTYVLELPGYKP
jgi:uncharacterized repeat protein (TIGR02543 family)